MNKIENTVWWITGASSGIGKNIALYILKNQGKVVFSSRNEANLQAIIYEENISENDYLILPFDLEKISNPEELVNKVMLKFRKIDFLINNGGISQRSIASETSIDIDRKIMETNFFGSVIITKAVLPIMIKQNSGHIVALSSIVGKFGFPLRSTYSASKHAIQGFFESLRAENYKHNISVSIVIPGRINTNISNNAINKNGESHGFLDEGQKNGLDATTAAEVIVNGILKKKKEILVGKNELLMLKIRLWFPSLFYKLVTKVKTT